MPDEAARIAVLESTVEIMTGEIAELKADRKSLMKWGLLALGSVVLGLIAFVVNLLHGGSSA